MQPWLDDEDTWRRRVAVTVVGRLPMKHPGQTARYLPMLEGLLGDTREEVAKATSFALRLAARGDAAQVAASLERHPGRPHGLGQDLGRGGQSARPGRWPRACRGM